MAILPEPENDQTRIQSLTQPSPEISPVPRDRSSLDVEQSLRIAYDPLSRDVSLVSISGIATAVKEGLSDLPKAQSIGPTAQFATISSTNTAGPALANCSPLFGNPGTTVAITGTGLGTSQGNSTLNVFLTTTNSWSTWPVTSWSDTQIVTTVPANMPQGKVYFYASVNGLQSAGTVTFTVGIPPVVTDRSPLFGNPGTSATITGTGFGASQGNSYVSVLSAVTNTWTTWSALSWSDTQIVATVPANMPLGKVYLYVWVNGLQSIGTITFTVGIPPVITQRSPLFGNPGTTVTLTGTGFGATQGNGFVSVLSAVDNHTWITWPALSWSDTQIVASIPSTMSLGKVYITVWAHGLQSMGTITFTVGMPPVITSWTPLFGNPGTTVTITGTGFGATQGNGFVSVLSAVDNHTWTTWPAVSWSDNQIVATVPANMPLGKVYITVWAHGLQSMGTDPFTVGIPPAIQCYSPLDGPPGTTVTINGTGFGSVQGASYVSVLSAVDNHTWTTWPAVSWSDNQIEATVPNDMPLGKVYLTVWVNNLQSIGTFPFTVGVPPVITAWSPLFGNPGTSVTITGTGFGASQGNSYVSVLSAVTNTWTTWSALSWSDTQIVATVPANMPLGKVYITVWVGGLQSIGTFPFTVGIPPTITSYAPRTGITGTKITIQGQGFGAVQGSSFVMLQWKFNSAATTLTVNSWSSTQVVVTIPNLTPIGWNFLSITVNGLQSIGTFPVCVDDSDGDNDCQ